MRSRTPRGNVFVANLPPDFGDERLAEIFDSFGIVLSAHVARDPASGRRLRYGFVDIATERAVERAVNEMNGVAIDGHQLDVRISERKTQPNQPKKPAPRAPRPIADRLETPPPAKETGKEEPAERGFGPTPSRPSRRRQTSFVVERRPLPRRI